MPWITQKQSIVALSSVEVCVSFRTTIKAKTTCQILGLPVHQSITTFEDNQACIKLINSDKCDTKHIDICHHHIRDLLERIEKDNQCQVLPYRTYYDS